MNEPQFKMQHLVDYLVLYKHITGKLPTEIKVSLEFYDWYVKEITDMAKRFGMDTTRQLKEVTFDGIKLLTK